MNFLRSLITDSYRAWRRSEPGTSGAALAYYALFSLPAVLIVVIASTSSFVGQGMIEQRIMFDLQNFFGGDTALMIKSIADQTRNSHVGFVAGMIGVFTIMFGSIGMFAQLQNSLNKIWNEKLPSVPGFLLSVRNKILAGTTVFVLGSLLMISLIATALMSLFNPFLQQLFPNFIDFIGLLTTTLSCVLISILFMFIYAFLPNTRISGRAVFYGSILTTAFFMIGRLFIQFYLGLSFVSSVYGAASAVVILLLFAYYSSQVFLFGAACTFAIDQRIKKDYY